MKFIAKKIQQGKPLEQLILLTGITLTLILSWFIISSVMFFLQTTVGTVGLFILSPFVALGIIAFSIIKYPKVKKYEDYPNYVKKYL